MSTNPQHQQSSYEQLSKQLVAYLIGLALFEFVLIAAGMLSFLFIDRRGLMQDIFPVGVMVLGAFGALPILFIVGRLVKLQEQFWKESAEQFGFAYMSKPWITRDALILRDGHGGKTGHGMQGMLAEVPLRVFQYSYTTGYGKNEHHHSYIIFEVPFSGTFPHLYLNNTRNRNLSGLGTMGLSALPLPHEFDKTFRLFAPKGYEIEGLEVFTPDFLSRLLDLSWEHDMELVEQKLYIFREKSIINKTQFDLEFERLKSILNFLSPILNRAKLALIGDLKHTL